MRIKEWDNAKTRDEVGNLNVEDTLLNGYNKMKFSGNKIIDLSDPVFTDSVESIVASLRENNIEEITMSYQSERLLDILANFERQGCQIAGLTKVEAYHTRKVVNAVKIEVN